VYGGQRAKEAPVFGAKPKLKTSLGFFRTAVEMFFKPRFWVFNKKSKNLKSPNFSFF